MAVEIPLFNVGICTAAADYSTTGQFLLVDVSADTVVTKASASGQACLGILQNKPVSGDVADVMVVGVSKLVAGAGDLAAGALFMAHTDGTGVTAAGVKTSMGMVIIGAAAGKLATVMLFPGMGGIVAAA
jgi:hypothetical protein